MSNLIRNQVFSDVGLVVPGTADVPKTFGRAKVVPRIFDPTGVPCPGKEEFPRTTNLVR